MDWVRRAGIRTVVTPVPDVQGLQFYGRTLPEYPAGTAVHRFPFLDTPGALPAPGWLDAVSEVVVEGVRSGPTLVHCLVGNNRSTIIVAAGLVLLEGINPAQALEWVRQVRSVHPDPALVQYLCDWRPREK